MNDNNNRQHLSNGSSGFDRRVDFLKRVQDYLEWRGFTEEQICAVFDAICFAVPPSAQRPTRPTEGNRRPKLT
jgi:hypothetical protein